MNTPSNNEVALANKIKKLARNLRKQIIENPDNLSKDELLLVRIEYTSLMRYVAAFQQRTNVEVANDFVLYPLPPTKVSSLLVQALLSQLKFEFHKGKNTNVVACFATLPNGHLLGSGSSNCVDDGEFSLDIAIQQAKQDALDKATKNIYEHETYAKFMSYTA